MAYDAWCEAPGRIAYAVYRAAEDRADAAEVALGEEHRRRARRRLIEVIATTTARRRAYSRVRGPGQRPVTEPDVSVNELRFLLDGVPDTRELVIRRAAAWAPELDAWRDAHEDAAAAYRHGAASATPAPTRAIARRRTARTPRRTRSPAEGGCFCRRCGRRLRPSCPPGAARASLRSSAPGRTRREPPTDLGQPPRVHHPRWVAWVGVPGRRSPGPSAPVRGRDLRPWGPEDRPRSPALAAGGPGSTIAARARQDRRPIGQTRTTPTDRAYGTGRRARPVVVDLRQRADLIGRASRRITSAPTAGVRYVAASMRAWKTATGHGQKRVASSGIASSTDRQRGFEALSSQRMPSRFAQSDTQRPRCRTALAGRARDNPRRRYHSFEAHAIAGRRRELVLLIARRAALCSSRRGPLRAARGAVLVIVVSAMTTCSAAVLPAAMIAGADHDQDGQDSSHCESDGDQRLAVRRPGYGESDGQEHQGHDSRHHDPPLCWRLIAGGMAPAAPERGIPHAKAPDRDDHDDDR